MSSSQEHLRIAKRLHFQGAYQEAIEEYELVLEMEPSNEDARAGLAILGKEVPDIDSVTSKLSQRLKTSFFDNQAKESNNSSAKHWIFKTLIVLVSAGLVYWLYTILMYYLNFDNITAMENVAVSFEKPRQQGELALVNVKISNFNPAPIRNTVITYKISDAAGNTIKEVTVPISAAIPAGDKRTFLGVQLGSIRGTIAKISAKLDSMQYGPKPKLTPVQAERFIAAASQKDRESLANFKELVEEIKGFAPVYVGLGRAYAANNYWIKAIESYNQAIALEPNNANAHYYLGVALFYSNKKKQAEKELNLAAQLAPDDPEISSSLSYLFLQTKQGLPQSQQTPVD